jgi:predicted metal-binding protein
MSEQTTGYQTHVFICTNSPDNPKKCGAKDSESLRKEVKEKCQALYGKSVRVNSAGCLGFCESGIASVIYSQNQPAEWNLKLDSSQSDFLMTRIKQIHGTLENDK